jgi:hypothetical protein
MIFFILADQKVQRKGIKNIMPLEFKGGTQLFWTVVSLGWSFFAITFYAFFIELTIIKPILDAYSYLPPESNEFILFIFLVTSGLIVRWVYILISPSIGNVLWDFFAIPGIVLVFITMIAGMFTGSSVSIDLAPLFIICFIAILFGFAGEVGLYLIRKAKSYTSKKTALHDVLNLIPLNSNVITGREQLYNNLAKMLDKGSGERLIPRSAVGTSIFFDTECGNKYYMALRNFIGSDRNSDVVRYLGPKTRMETSKETDSEFRLRLENISKREQLGVKIRHYPLNPDSFRFLVVNKRYVSIEFPFSTNEKSLEKSKSMIAICMDNGMIANFLCTLFENMWETSSIPTPPTSASPSPTSTTPVSHVSDTESEEGSIVNDTIVQS